jgi:hypothetical protein
MRISVFAATVALTLTGAPALALSEPAATPPAPEAQAAESDATRMVCRRIEVMGSRLSSKRVCMTAAEWTARRESDRKSIEQSQTQRYSGNTSG